MYGAGTGTQGSSYVATLIDFNPFRIFMWDMDLRSTGGRADGGGAARSEIGRGMVVAINMALRWSFVLALALPLLTLLVKSRTGN